MRRRSFLSGVAALAASHYASAQQPSTVPLVGVILASPVNSPFAAAFRQGLKDLGYVEGKNIRLELRSTDGRPERFSELAVQIVHLKPDVIVAGGGGPSAQAVMKLTRVIPIVFPASADPVAEGLVQSLARPGGNVTGLSIISSEINAKRLEVLKQLLPKARNVGLLVDPRMGARNEEAAAVGTQRAARTLGLQLEVLRAKAPEEFAAVFRSAKKSGLDALVVAASSTYNVHRQRLVELAAENRLAAVWEHRQFVLAGGLLSYGPDIADLYRSAARYVHQILKGAKPGDLAVEQATKLELVINMKTANALGLAIPGAVLARADQIIE